MTGPTPAPPAPAPPAVPPAPAAPPASSTPRLIRITGWVLSVLPCLLLTFSGLMKFSGSPQLSDGFKHLGWPEKLAVPLGVLELACVLIYLFPPTAVLGAVLLTGYLGGAIATHLRIEEGFIPQAVLGVLLWLGLFLRDARVRSLLPIRFPNR